METLRRSLRRQKTSVKTVSSRVALHGVADVVESPSLSVQVFWGVLVSASAIILVIGVWGNISDFLNSPILTSYSLKASHAMAFPDVYICPMSPMRKNVYDAERGQQFLNPVQDNTLLGKKTKVYDKADAVGDMKQEGYAEPAPSPRKKKEETFAEYFMANGFDVNEIFKECMFQQMGMPCSNITVRMFDKNYGLCFLIRPGRNQTTAGAGLQLVVDLHSDMRSFDPLLNGVGITIAHQFDPTATTAKQLFAPAGGLSKISLEATHMHLINYSSSTARHQQQCCTEGDFVALQNVNYSQSACKMDCMQRSVQRLCNCSLPLDDALLTNDYKDQCPPKNASQCLDEAVVKLNESLNQCMTHCLPPCESWSYTHSFSHIPFNKNAPVAKSSIENRPGLPLVGQPGTKPNQPEYFARLNTDILILDIAFGEIQHIEVTQSRSMSIDTFISNVGGQMGLWLGASVVSVVQILCVLSFCFYEGVKKPVKQHKQKKTTKRSEKDANEQTTKTTDETNDLMDNSEDK